MVAWVIMAPASVQLLTPTVSVTLATVIRLTPTGSITIGQGLPMVEPVTPRNFWFYLCIGLLLISLATVLFYAWIMR